MGGDDRIWLEKQRGWEEEEDPRAGSMGVLNNSN